MGVYEPAVIDFPDGRVLHASMAALREEVREGTVVRHRACRRERFAAAESFA